MKIRLIDRENIIYLVDNLENFEKDSAIKSGLRAAVQVFRTGGRGRLGQRLKRTGRTTNHLLNSFTTRVKRTKLGSLAGFDRPGGNHAHLVDQGTKRRYTKSGAYRGIMPGNHFWEDTRNQDEGKALSKLQQGVQRAVDRINARR